MIPGSKMEKNNNHKIKANAAQKPQQKKNAHTYICICERKGETGEN